MRADIVVRLGRSTITRELRYRTRSDLYAAAPEVGRRMFSRLMPDERHDFLGDMEVRPLALIPHPEEYQGPVDPDWERMLDRLAIEMLANRVRDWIDGYDVALSLAGRWLSHGDRGLATHLHFRVDYARIRDLLLERGYDEATAQRVAMRATAEEPRFLPRLQRPI